MNKLKELLFLKELKGVGKKTIHRNYVEYLAKSASFEEMYKFVLETHGYKYNRSDIESAQIAAEKKYKHFSTDPELTVVTLFDECYPEKLRVMKENAPLVLYIKGDLRVFNEDNIAIVGTRHPSKWSQGVEENLVTKILDISDRVIISGLALGCDKIAHETTVNKQRKTIAVLPSGVNVITPASHKKLADRILENGGCLVSEYEPDQKATRSSFVERDAVIAALSDVTFVIECEVKSGTMHTVDAAYAYKRRLACYYHEDMSRGNYNGNLHMINNMGAVKVSNNEGLERLLQLLQKADDPQGSKNDNDLEQLKLSL